MSPRGPGGTWMPKSTFMYVARTGKSSPGVVASPLKNASFAGVPAFQRSFLPTPTRTSLTSGLPSRETCVYAPPDVIVPSALIVRVDGMLTVDQAPRIAAGFAGSVTWVAVDVSMEIGTVSVVVRTV